MNTIFKRVVFSSIVLFTFLPFNSLLFARPVSKTDAKMVVQGWLKSGPYFVKNGGRLKIKNVKSYRNKQQKIIFYVAELSPSGFVIVAPDDLIEPIIAYSRNKEFIQNNNNFLWLLSTKDMGSRVKHAVAIEKKRLSSPATKLSAAIRNAEKKWKLFKQYAGNNLPVRNISSVNDPRVDPIIESEWGQSAVNSEACYNYYTPTGSGDWQVDNPANYPCGCVATAMGQVMRYFQHPTTDVGTGSFTVTVDGSDETKQMRGGDGSGGAYDWSKITLIPESGISAAGREAIGALLYDCGVSVNMSYTSSGSGAYTFEVAEALVTTYHYSNAIYGAGTIDMSGTELNTMVNPNLDAGSPVLLGVNNSGSGGHAIVCDGYGYDSSTLYHHLNMGWSGYDDAWYNLPTIQGGFADFNTVSTCVYNIYLTGTGEIISGRVTDSDGVAQANLTITAKAGSSEYTTTTNTRGIWAIKNLPSNTTYTVSCEGASASASVKTDISAPGFNGSETVGNVWGVDFTVPTKPEIALDPTELTPLTATGRNATPDKFQVWNSGKDTLNYSISTDVDWMSVSPSSGDSTGTTDKDTITVNYDNATLSAGTYTGTISVTDPNASNSPQTVSVILTIVDKAYIDVDVTTIYASCNYGETPSPQTINVCNSVKNTTLTFKASKDVSWLTVTPSKGVSIGPDDICEITFTFNTSKLGIGKYNTTVSINDPNSFNTCVTILVYLTVGPADSIPTDNLSSFLNCAGNAIGIDAHNRVYSIGDESGNGVVVVQDRKNRQPLLSEAIAGETSLLFDGKQFLYTGSQKGINTGGPFSEKTITVAFRTGNDVFTRQVLLAQGTSKRGFNVYIFEHNVFFAIWNTEDDAGINTGWGPVYISAEVLASTFYCMTFVFDGSSETLKGYKNGTLFNTTTGTGELLYDSKFGLSIGRAFKPTLFHDGKMRAKGYMGHFCDFLYHNDVLDSTEITNIFQYINSKYSGSFTDTDAFVLHLKASFGIDKDQSGYLISWRNSTSTFQFKSRGNKAPTWDDELYNSQPGIIFDGTGDIMKAKNNKKINGCREGFENKTMFIVFKTGRNITNQQVIWAQGNQKTGINFYIAGGNLYMGAWNHIGRNNSNSWGPVFINGTISAETVYSLEFLFDSSTIKGYLKALTSTGTKVELGTASASGKLEKHSPASLGGSKAKLRDANGIMNPGNYFSGSIFEILVYDKTLTSTQSSEIDDYFAGKYIP